MSNNDPEDEPKQEPAPVQNSQQEAARGFGRIALLHAEVAVIPLQKLAGYLLAPEHPEGRGKAAFFARFGFSRERPEVLAAALRQHAVTHDVTAAEPSPFGTRYVIEGQLRAPDGRAPRVRAVWFVAPDDPAPRFVTAYPLPA